MADTKITALTAITTVDPAADVLPIVDVSDTSMAASGTTKKITSNQILGAGGTATLASATITGALTVQGVGGISIGSASFTSGRALAATSPAGSAVGIRLLQSATSDWEITNVATAGNLSITQSGANLLSLTGAGVFTFGDGAGGTRMTLNANGLGIGVTPSAWASVVGIQSAYGALSGNTNINILRNSYYNGGWKYTANGRATQYQQDVASHIWYYDTGTQVAGTACSFTAAMTLDGSGQLGIGVTSPRSKADVYGTLTVGSNTAPNCDFKRDVAIAGADSGIGSLNYGARYDATNYGVGALITGQSAGAWTSTSTPGYISFRTTPSSATTPVEGMRLDASGRLLVGTTDSGSNSGIGLKAAYSATAPYFATVGSSNASNTYSYLLYSTTDAAFKFYVSYSGQISATSGTISAISDARLKENVQDIDVGLGAILALKPRKFDWKEGKGKNIKGDRGFIAQEFEEVFPNLIDEWKDAAPEGEAPYKSVRQDLIPVLVKAIQELTARVQTLETR